MDVDKKFQSLALREASGWQEVQCELPKVVKKSVKSGPLVMKKVLPSSGLRDLIKARRKEKEETDKSMNINEDKDIVPDVVTDTEVSPIQFNGGFFSITSPAVAKSPMMTRFA